MESCEPRQSAVLVVEDDEPLRDAIAMALAQEGHEVVLAATGEEALDFIRWAGPFAALYTDIDLPGQVTGWQVAQAFIKQWPKRPVVYASGRDLSGARVPKKAVVLQKPFSYFALVEALTR